MVSRTVDADEPARDGVTCCPVERSLSFEWLYQQHLDGVYAYLLARVGNAEDAADLAQQVFVQALAGLPRFRGPEAAAKVWLFRIARNLVVDAYRRRRPPVGVEQNAPWQPPAVADGPEAAALLRELQAEVRLVLARLTAGERELLALRFAAGLSSTEIAAVTGKNAAGVKKRLTRLLHRLREDYDDPR